MEGEGKAVKTPGGATPQNFDKEFFVHARHTCDGCGKSPIIGTRHHATKIPDFDLCTACFEKYEGEALDFVPAIHDRDRRMQPKWLKRQLKQLKATSKLVSDVTAVWKDSNGDIVDFLKKMQEPGDGVDPAANANSASEPEASGKTQERAPPPFCGVSNPLKDEQKSAGSPPATKSEAPPAKEAPWKKEESVENSPTMVPEAPSVKEAPKSADANHDATKPRTPSAEEVPLKKEEESVERSPATKPEAPSVKEAPKSPGASQDESFLSDADGSGSIAEAIGRTLDVCVKEIEKAITDGVEEMDDDGAASSKGKESTLKFCDDNTVEEGAAAVATDVFSSATSVVSNMSDASKKKDDAKMAHNIVADEAPSVKEAPKSPCASQDESFLSD